MIDSIFRLKVKINFSGVKLKCQANKQKINELSKEPDFKFKDPDHLVSTLNSLIKRTEKVKKKILKSKVQCSNSPYSKGVTNEDVKQLIEILCLVNPLFENAEGYIDDLEDHLIN